LKEKLKKITDDLYSCLQCGYCVNICPAYGQFEWESSSPRGKLFYLKELSNKGILDKIFGRKVDLTDEFFQRFYHCTSCAACNEVCHVNIDLAELWEEVKEWMIKEGMEVLPQHKVLLERISDPNKRNPFFDEKDPQRDTLAKRADWLPEGIELSDNPEVIFFVGCTTSYRIPILAQSTVELLSKAKVPFSILGPDEWCCGSPLLRTGQGDIIKNEYAQHNVDEIVKRGAKIVTTACAGCCNTLKNNYPKILGELPFKVYHISELIEKLIDDGRLKFTKPVNKTITYHDPCHLGRHAGVYDAPRNILKSIPGVKLIEMPRNREKARCCGAGAGFKIAYNPKAEDIAVDRVKEAKATGAELIVTPCPFCVVNLNAGAKKGEIPLKTVDLMQFLLDAM